MATAEQELARRTAAKRFNAYVSLLADTWNTLVLAVLIAAVITPIVESKDAMAALTALNGIIAMWCFRAPFDGISGIAVFQGRMTSMPAEFLIGSLVVLTVVGCLMLLGVRIAAKRFDERPPVDLDSSASEPHSELTASDVAGGRKGAEMREQPDEERRRRAEALIDRLAARLEKEIDDLASEKAYSAGGGAAKRDRN